MGMNKRNIIIVSLLAVAVILFCCIRFWLIPLKEEKNAKYEKEQADALTHSIESINSYKSPFMGDASNIGNLFYHLPMNDVAMDFEIHSETYALTINYKDTAENTGKEKVLRNLAYNSIAAMAAIDNLDSITYHFTELSYSFTRKQIEDIFGSPLSNLLEPAVWKEKVQNNLKSKEFIEQFYP